jgi:hypothetical protein
MSDEITRTLMGEPEPQFICIAHLHKGTSRSGKTYYAGTMIEPGTSTPLRLYVFVNEPRQASKDTGPALRVALRTADYERLRKKLPAALAGLPRDLGSPRPEGTRE